MGAAMLLISNFLHFWPQHKQFFPPNITLVIALWHWDCPGTPSECPSLPLQAVHPFVKEGACC
jgi:hypothetical protein